MIGFCRKPIILRPCERPSCSALASTITLLDLTGMARTIIARTYTPVEIFITAGVIYLLLTFLFTRAFRQLERRANRYLTQAR